jgi:hypothetical protein
MNPAKFSQMMKYLTRAKKEKPDLPDVFPASKAPIPAKTQNVQETEAVNQFMLRNPRVEKAGGGRIGFMKGELVTQGPNTGKVKVRNLKLIKDKKGKIIKREIAYFKDMPAANAAIKKHKEGKFGQLKFKKSKKILNNPKLKKEFLKYAMGKDVTGKMIRKKYGLSNEEFFQGGLREILDKDFLQYSKSSAVKSNTIKNMLLLHNNKLSKNYIRNGLVVPDEIIEKLGLNEAEAATATARLSQHYSGRDFGFKELKSIRRNNKAGDKLFEAMNKFSFGNPYRSKLYNISLQLIDKQLGNETGTFESLKKKASYILKKNKIKGFDINEIAGVTGTAKTGVGEFSQFIDIMDSNLNQKQMASFQAAFSTARQNIKNDPNSFATESKRINKLAGIFEREYGVQLPRIRNLNEVEKYYSPNRLKELADQGLDIKTASKKLGYTVQMPKSAVTVQEFAQQTPKAIKGLKAFMKANGITCNLNQGLNCNFPQAYEKSLNELSTKAQAGDQAAAAKMTNFAKSVRGAGSVIKGVLGPAALVFEAGVAVPLGLFEYSQGKPATEIVDSLSYGLFGKSRDDRLKEQMPAYGQVENLQNIDQRIQNLGRLQEGTKGQKLRSKPKFEKAKEEFQTAAEPFLSLENPAAGMLENLKQSEDLRQKLIDEDLQRKQERKTPFDLSDPFMAAKGGRAGFKLGTLRKGIQALIDKSVKSTPKDTTSDLDALIKKALDEDFFDKKDRIIDNINLKIDRARAKGLDSKEIGEGQIEFYDDITKSNFKTKTGPFFDRRKRAGGGILKQAGDSSGPPPESGPNPQGLQGLLKRGNKI